MTRSRREKSWWDGETPQDPSKMPAMTVIVEDPETWTGLYDAQGRKLHRAPEPFGFRR